MSVAGSPTRLISEQSRLAWLKVQLSIVGKLQVPPAPVHPIPGGFIGVNDRCDRLYPGIVDEDVERTKLRVGGTEVQEYDLHFTGAPADLDKVIAESDVVSLHLHLNPETRHILDRRRLQLMKPSAFLVNVARGALVDETALSEALMAGRIGGAGLDTFREEPPDLRSRLLGSILCTVSINSKGRFRDSFVALFPAALDNRYRICCMAGPVKETKRPRLCGLPVSRLGTCL